MTGQPRAMELTVRTETAAGVAFVSAIVSNPTPDPRRFRLTNRLDGPVRPPRVHGVPAAGWDDDGYEGVLAGGARLPLGYAVRVEGTDATDGPIGDAAEIVWTEPAGDSEPDPTPAAVVRTAGDPRPPIDVIVRPYRRPRSGTEPTSVDGP